MNMSKWVVGDLHTAEGVVRCWCFWVPDALHILEVDDLTLHTYMGQHVTKNIHVTIHKFNKNYDFFFLS